jgi:hypothetical protein
MAREAMTKGWDQGKTFPPRFCLVSDSHFIRAAFCNQGGDSLGPR